MKENAVVREILACFSYHQFYVLPGNLHVFPYIDRKTNRGFVGRRNTGAAFMGERKTRFTRFNPPGTADIEGVLFGDPAIPISVEAKAGTKLSESQGNYLRTLLDGGGLALVSHSYGETHQWFKLLKFCDKADCK